MLVLVWKTCSRWRKSLSDALRGISYVQLQRHWELARRRSLWCDFSFVDEICFRSRKPLINGDVLWRRKDNASEIREDLGKKWWCHQSAATWRKYVIAARGKESILENRESQFDIYPLHWICTAEEETTPYAITEILRRCGRWVLRYFTDDQKIEFSELQFHIFKGLKKKPCSCNPQWQAMSQGFTILLLKQDKLECSGNHPGSPREKKRKKKSKHVILLEKL